MGWRVFARRSCWGEALWGKKDVDRLQTKPMLTVFHIPALRATADDDEDDANDDYDHVDYDADEDHLIKFDVRCMVYVVCCLIMMYGV